MPRRAALLTFTLGLAAAMIGACDPCAGTPSCHGFPELSYSGQFIERATGRPVAGVVIRFVRDTGALLNTDTVVGISDADGFFELRTGAYTDGAVVGRLEVSPPAPHAPYAVPGFVLRTSRVRGEGNVGGRLVVDPYAQVIGEVWDRRTGRGVPGAVVRLTLVDDGGGVVAGPATAELNTDQLGRFLMNPVVRGYGDFTYEVTLTVPGDTQTYRIPFTVTTDYLDRTPYARLIKFPRQLRYQIEVSRRGTGEFLPGVQVQWVRTGGIPVDPDTITGAPSAGGRFTIEPTPETDGTVIGRIIITPPAPLQPEILENVVMVTDHSDTLKFLGVFGYGPQAYMLMHLRNRWNDSLGGGGTHGIITRAGGVAFVYPPGSNPAADSGIRSVDTLGRLPYIAGTADTGEVVLDVRVRFPGFLSDSFPGVRVRARSDSVANQFGPMRVGPWFPWYVEVRDMDTDLPIAGARVEFRRTAGVVMAPTNLARITGADGRARLGAEPLARGTAIGTVVFSFPGGGYRDSTVNAVSLTTSQDDTLRQRGVYRFRRQ